MSRRPAYYALLTFEARNRAFHVPQEQLHKQLNGYGPDVRNTVVIAGLLATAGD